MDLHFDNRVLPIYSYRGWPRIGRPMELVVQGTKCEARTTKWKEHKLTYFIYMNTVLFVKEHLPFGAEVRLTDIPDGFGGLYKPEPRKSYYKERLKAREMMEAAAKEEEVQKELDLQNN